MQMMQATDRAHTGRSLLVTNRGQVFRNQPQLLVTHRGEIDHRPTSSGETGSSKRDEGKAEASNRTKVIHLTR
jgi:hypothetical protein